LFHRGGGKDVFVFAGEIEIGSGDFDAFQVELFVADPNGDEALGMVNPSRMKKQPIDDAEDGGISADAEGKREYSDGGERRRFREQPKREFKVLEDCAH
jgi:hypothetical protein